MNPEYQLDRELRAQDFGEAVRSMDFDPKIFQLAVAVDSELLEVWYLERASSPDGDPDADFEMESLDRTDTELGQDLAHITIVAPDGYQMDLALLAGQINVIAQQFSGKTNKEAVIQRKFTSRAIRAQTHGLGGKSESEKELFCRLVYVFRSDDLK